VFVHLPCLQGVSPGPLGEVILPGANGQYDPKEGLILLESQSEGLRCTTEPVRSRSQQGEHCLSDCKSLCSNSGLPQEAEGESD
jgi:hypothetical protein